MQLQQRMLQSGKGKSDCPECIIYRRTEVFWKKGIHMEMNGVQRLENGQTGVSRNTSVTNTGGNQVSFEKLLQKSAREGLNFSKHAAKRMNERGIAVDSQLMSNLEHAVEGARKKGARDVAVIGAQGVFIVNVPNNTVVTTMSQSDMRERVFTNIDSAVLM